MILFDSTKCRDCGTCLTIRGGYCLTRDGSEIRVDRTLCNECGECVSRCPAQAFSFQGHGTERLDRGARARPEALEELLAGRRSTRRYTEEPVDRAALLALARVARHAPSMNHEIEAVLVDDPELLREIDQRLTTFYRRMYGLLFRNPIVHGLIRLFANGMEVTKRKMEHSFADGGTLYNAPALVVLTGSRRTPMTELSAQFCLSNMILYAESLGLATCLMDSVKIGVNALGGLRKLLRIPRGHAVVGALHVGHPAYKVWNKAASVSLPVRCAPRRETTSARTASKRPSPTTSI
jgi:nitroreductase/NAD-dependent dihydropyrimidine dehydrogenase PreA subunit